MPPACRIGNWPNHIEDKTGGGVVKAQMLQEVFEIASKQPK
jgi:hypothetical protein